MADEPSAEPEPTTIAVRKFEWQRMVFRLEAGIEFKAIAWAYSLFADADGSNVKPGRDLIADGVERSERATGDYLGELLNLGLLTVTRRGGGRGGAGTATVYRLSMPAAGALPMRLDPDLNRIAPRTPGRRPDKALEACARKRGITYTDRNPASAQSGADPLIDRNPASGESDSDPLIDRNPASAQSGAELLIERNPASGGSDSEPPFDENPASGRSDPGAPTERKRASGGSSAEPAIEENPPSPQWPVDNSTDRKPGFRSKREGAGNHRNPASGENDFHRKPQADSPEAEGPLSGSLASNYQLTKVTKNQSVVSLGGDLTRTLDDELLASMSASDEDPYDIARTVVADVDPEDLGDLLSDARAELVYGGDHEPDHRRILMRAAVIATRQSRSHP